MKNFKNYINSVDLNKLGEALKRKETFVGMEEKVEINSSGIGATVVRKVQNCKITPKFIEDNFDKLVSLNIIKEK